MEASTSSGPTRRRPAKAKSAPESDGSVNLEFELDKETKGAVRFAEVARKGEEAYVRTFYMRKELWDQLEKSESLIITITPNE
jgi:hypothetical protein